LQTKFNNKEMQQKIQILLNQFILRQQDLILLIDENINQPKNKKGKIDEKIKKLLKQIFDHLISLK
jgi:hypothetical protein